MSKHDFEKYMFDTMIEIREKYKEFAPDLDYLSMALVNGHIHVNNCETDEKRIDLYFDGTELFDITFGGLWRSDENCTLD